MKWLLRAMRGAASSIEHRNWGSWEQSRAQEPGTFHSSLVISSDPGRDLCRCQSHKIHQGASLKAKSGRNDFSYP